MTIIHLDSGEVGQGVKPAIISGPAPHLGGLVSQHFGGDPQGLPIVLGKQGARSLHALAAPPHPLKTIQFHVILHESIRFEAVLRSLGPHAEIKMLSSTPYS